MCLFMLLSIIVVKMVMVVVLKFRFIVCIMVKKFVNSVVVVNVLGSR